MDTCGWPTDASQQQWTVRPAPGGHGSTIVSAHTGQCLALAGALLDRYAGPLSGGRATVVLFNRSPHPAAMSVSVDDVRSAVPGFAVGAAGVSATDLWTGAVSALSGGTFSATVPSHSVVHVNLVADA